MSRPGVLSLVPSASLQRKTVLSLSDLGAVAYEEEAEADSSSSSGCSPTALILEPSRQELINPHSLLQCAGMRAATDTFAGTFSEHTLSMLVLYCAGWHPSQDFIGTLAHSSSGGVPSTPWL